MERLVGRGGEKYAKIAQEILEVLVLMPDSPLKRRNWNGAMCIMNRRTGRKMSIWVIGQIMGGIRLSKCMNAAEKRAQDDYERLVRKLSKTGEKAAIGKYIISCFVDTDEVNLALALMVSVNAEDISLKRAETIARASNNNLFFDLFELLKPLKE